MEGLQPEAQQPAEGVPPPAALRSVDQRLCATDYDGAENFAGERTIAEIRGVVLREMGGQVWTGGLVLTNYRVVFLSKAEGGRVRPVSLPLCSLDEVAALRGLATRDGTLNVASVRLSTKDGRVYYFVRDDAMVAEIGNWSRRSMATIDDYAEIRVEPRAQSRAASVKKKGRGRLKSSHGSTDGDMTPEEAATLAQLQAWCVRVHDQIRAQGCEGPHSFDSTYLRRPRSRLDEAGRGFVDLRAEFQRLGVGTELSRWRFTDFNASFSASPTYPRILAVPQGCTDELLVEVAQFRSKQRLPVLAWINPATHAAILRCSQPLVGIIGHHSEADERFFQVRFCNLERMSLVGLIACLIPTSL